MRASACSSSWGGRETRAFYFSVCVLSVVSASSGTRTAQEWRGRKQKTQRQIRTIFLRKSTKSRSEISEKPCQNRRKISQWVGQERVPGRSRTVPGRSRTVPGRSRSSPRGRPPLRNEGTLPLLLSTSSAVHLSCTQTLQRTSVSLWRDRVSHTDSLARQKLSAHGGQA